MFKFRTLILTSVILTVAGSAAHANSASVGFNAVGAVVAINPQPLPPIDRDRQEEGFDLSSIGASYDVAIKPQPLPPIERERDEDLEDMS